MSKEGKTGKRLTNLGFLAMVAGIVLAMAEVHDWGTGLLLGGFFVVVVGRMLT